MVGQGSCVSGACLALSYDRVISVFTLFRVLLTGSLIMDLYIYIYVCVYLHLCGETMSFACDTSRGEVIWPKKEIPCCILHSHVPPWVSSLWRRTWTFSHAIIGCMRSCRPHLDRKAAGWCAALWPMRPRHSCPVKRSFTSEPYFWIKSAPGLRIWRAYAL